MTELKEYFKQPSTMWKIIVGIFVMWMFYANINTSMGHIDNRVGKIESLWLDSRLASIETKLDMIINKFNQ